MNKIRYILSVEGIMRPTLLLVILAVPSIRATSLTSVVCSLGSISVNATSSCSIPVGNGGEISAFAEIRGAGTSEISASAGGGATLDPGTAWFAGGTATYTEQFTTPGPVREGLLGIVAGSFGGFSEGGILQNGWGYSGNVCCLPFQLGKPFQVFVSASAGAGGGPAGANDSGASVKFMLTEADTTTYVGALPLAIPEPGSATLLLLGILASAVCGRRLRRS